MSSLFSLHKQFDGNSVDFMKNAKHTVSAKFPERLRLARQQKGFTQGQLAQRVGSDSQRISKYERGVMVPTTPILVKLADALDVSLDYLLRDAEDKPIGKIRDAALLDQFTQIDSLAEDDKQLVKGLLDAFIKKNKFEMLAQN